MTGARGAYGFRLAGVEAARPLLVPAAAGWPPLTIVARLGFGDRSPNRIGRDAARLRLTSGGRVELDRKRGSALFILRRRLSADELVSTHLAPVAAVASRWHGLESFNAGAVVLGDGAWAVMGPREAGKSSLLAWLAMGGFPVLTDELLVVDHELRALAGPRAIELRGGAARKLGLGRPAGANEPRESYRMALGEVSPAVPLRGFVKLAWGDVPAVTPVPTAWRGAELACRGIRLGRADSRGVDGPLAALPMFELRRPRDWEAAGLSADRLLEALAG